MQNFYTDFFQISKISLCILVKSGQGRRHHVDRRHHGLVYQLTGHNRYAFSNGTRLTLHKGQVLYLPKSSSYEAANDSGDCLAVNFDLADPALSYPAFTTDARFASVYEKLFQGLQQYWTQRPVGYENQCCRLLYEILCCIQQEKNRQYVHSSQRLLADRGAAYLAAHLAEEALTVSSAAMHLKVTPEYFRKRFRETYGVSPRQYIISRRIAMAKELIQSGEFKMHRIAQLCGYRSASYFSTEFRAITGISPQEYRKQMMA